MTANAIDILRSHSLPMLLEQEIERVILGGELRPGDRINEKELALRFGISRGPVREALRSLELTGLVEQIPNRGVFVRQLTAAQADDIYEVRAALFWPGGQTLGGTCDGRGDRAPAYLRSGDGRCGRGRRFRPLPSRISRSTNSSCERAGNAALA